MSTVAQPVFSDIADLFTWKTIQTLTTNVVGTAGQFGTDQVKTLDNSCFVFMAFRGWTNYDPAVQLRASVGAGPAAATAIFPATVPNNFSVKVKRNNRFDLFGSDNPIPQACIASTGYRAGQQVPIPIIYPPRTTFNFTIFNTAEVLFLNADATAKNLVVHFGLFGYNVLNDNMREFLGAWPELYGKAMDQLTRINIGPGF
jgi:hypothetical protein